MAAPRLTFGQDRLCPKCEGAGRLTRTGQKIGPQLVNALLERGPLELPGGALEPNPTPAQRKAAYADAIDRTRECGKCAGSGIAP